ncbi:transposase [Streptomonospora alba]|uniref:transposase n=1 Tax=Streptomonospora alba TaxID=183763 RepID=UPI000ABE2CC5|nr:transposase [Streptomonospora alba]
MEIVGELGLARNTVHRFACAPAAEDLLARDGTGKRPRHVAGYDAYLGERVTQGCTNAAVLWNELQQQGYGGSDASVRDYIRPWRSDAAPPAPARPITVRQVTAWLLSHPDHLDQEQQLQLKAVLDACPELQRLSERVQGFARMMAHRQGHRWEERTKAARGEWILELDSFVRGLRRDWDAVVAGLTLPHSSGVVEGHVNRLKMLKRQMYGRANPDLLRKRVLLAA